MKEQPAIKFAEISLKPFATRDDFMKLFREDMSGF